MKTSKSSLFLMELIIAILFFALASAVCIQLFVKSHLLGNTTSEESHALLLCQNLSEIYLGILPGHYKDEAAALKESLLNILKEDEQFQNPITVQIDYQNNTLNGLSPESGTDFPNLLDMLPESFLEEIPDDCAFTEHSFAFLLCFDKNWQPCSFENSLYQLLFIQEGYSAESDVYSASSFIYKINRDGNPEDNYEEIYHLNVCKHIPEKMH